MVWKFGPLAWRGEEGVFVFDSLVVFFFLYIVCNPPCLRVQVIPLAGGPIVVEVKAGASI
jgi:hypothetical protein